MLLDAEWDNGIGHFVRKVDTYNDQPWPLYAYQFFTSKGVEVTDKKLVEELRSSYCTPRAYVWRGGGLQNVWSDKLAQQMREEEDKRILDAMKYMVTSGGNTAQINEGDTVTIRMPNIGLTN